LVTGVIFAWPQNCCLFTFITRILLKYYVWQIFAVLWVVHDICLCILEQTEEVFSVKVSHSLGSVIHSFIHLLVSRFFQLAPIPFWIQNKQSRSLADHTLQSTVGATLFVVLWSTTSLRMMPQDFFLKKCSQGPYMYNII
jgi:hypothetical protein